MSTLLGSFSSNFKTNDIMLSILNQLSTDLKHRQKIEICGLQGSSAALFAARLHTMQAQQQALCCIVPTDDLLEPLAGDISLFTNVPVLIYPAFEIAPYTRLAPDPATTATRLSTLYFLQERSQPCIVLTSAEALLRRVMPKRVLSNHCELVMTGEEADREGLIVALTRAGYQPCELVRQPGDLAIRGGIVDLYPPASQLETQGPLRLDFFDDTVDSIRLFDPLSQRSLEELDEAVLLPASDILFPNNPEGVKRWQQELPSATSDEDRQMLQQLREQIRFPGIEFFLPLIYQQPETLFDYLPAETLFLLHDPLAISRKIELVWERIAVNYEEAAAEGLALAPKTLFLESAELERLEQTLRIDLCLQPNPDALQPPIIQQAGDHSLLSQEIDLQRKKRGILAPLADRLL
ncbi:MAG: transcription-repair coupling factor, partial [Candidatus Electrothrix sp. AR3]|nr:transcription-repair coupling factor [Candidatus Electrothrix sp. AR3]